jgi:pimeloyl-ACP methyl ester carboxylesterase
MHPCRRAVSSPSARWTAPRSMSRNTVPGRGRRRPSSCSSTAGRVRRTSGRRSSASWRTASGPRGHGRSGIPGRDSGGYSTDALADDLTAVLDAVLQAGERAVLVGHSMGGMTAMAAADPVADPGPYGRRAAREHRQRTAGRGHQGAAGAGAFAASADLGTPARADQPADQGRLEVRAGFKRAPTSGARDAWPWAMNCRRSRWIGAGQVIRWAAAMTVARARWRRS